MVAALGDARADVGRRIAAMKRLLLACALLIAGTAHAKLTFIEDDYAAAVARAKAKDVPIFVEAWAPW